MMTDRLEVEIKYPVADAADFRARATAAAGRPPQTEKQTDRYFQAPDRNFALTDEALRVRVSAGGARLTYKGPKLDAATKTRRELEVPFPTSGADDLVELLGALGYRLTLAVRKTRESWRLTRGGRACEVCLDHVAGLPPHAEIETLAPATELDSARGVLTALATELGLDGPTERRSYLELLLAAGPAP